MAVTDNLLLGLHKWAWHQDENFLTEALAYLLRYLLENEPATGVVLLKILTCDRVIVDVTQARSVDVRTQITTAMGRPDIEIRTLDHLAYIEAKVESGLGDCQLHRYRKWLDAADFSKKTLVLLTRYPFDASVLNIRDEADGFVRWWKLAELLRDQLNHKRLGTPVGQFLVDQFVGFLFERGVTVEQVTWELRNGVRAMRSLLTMLGEALQGVKIKPKVQCASEYIGYYFDSSKFWVGISFDKPTIVEFQTCDIKFDPKAASELGFGEVQKATWLTSGQRWVDRLDLEAESVHFFARPPASQIQTLEKFLNKAVDGGRRCEAKSD